MKSTASATTRHTAAPPNVSGVPISNTTLKTVEHAASSVRGRLQSAIEEHARLVSESLKNSVMGSVRPCGTRPIAVDVA